MRIPHDGMVMVADGAKMLFFRNAGEADRIDLVVDAAEQQKDERAGDQGTDISGEAPAGGGQGGATMGYTDYHKQSEERFAAEAAALLNRQAEAGAFKSVVVVAPPKTLGAMRKHYGRQLEAKLGGELAKDLTGHPVDQIAALLERAE